MKTINFILSFLIVAVGLAFSSWLFIILSLPSFIRITNLGVILTCFSVSINGLMAAFCAIKFSKWFKKHTK